MDMHEMSDLLIDEVNAAIDAARTEQEDAA